MTQNLQSILYGCEIGTSQSFSTFGNVWNNTLTSKHGGLEMSSRGFELAWKSVVFRVFPAVFARSLLIQQRKGNGRRLVHEMANDFARYFDRWIIFSLEYLSWKIFWGLKIILWTFSRYSSCFMWNVEIGRSSGRRAERFFCEAIVCGKMTAFWEDSGRLSNSKMNMRDDIKLFPVLPVFLFPVLLQLPTLEIGTAWFLVIVFIDLLHVISALTPVTWSTHSTLSG